MERELTLLPIQLDLLRSSKTVAGIYSGRGVGKTWILSVLAALAVIEGKKVLAFSQDYRSLTMNLFSEILSRLDHLCPGRKVKYNKSMASIQVSGLGSVLGFSYENPDACRSQTNCSLLLCDEIALAPPSLFSTAIPCLRGEHIIPEVRFASTPRAGTYWNEEIRRRLEDHTWDIFQAPMTSNTFLSRESIDASFTSIADEDLRRQELLGEILDSGASGSILLPGDFSRDKAVSTGDLVAGIDFARWGQDKTVITFRSSSELLEQRSLSHADTSEIWTTFRSMCSRWGDPLMTYLDATGGWHIGFFDTYRDHIPLCEVNFSSRSSDSWSLNKRTEMYFNLASAVKSGFYIPQRTDIVLELLNTAYTIDQRGRRRLEPKESIKAKIGRSPDSADSLALTFSESPEERSATPERLAQLTRLLYRN